MTCGGLVRDVAYSVASYGETRIFEGSSLAPLEPLMRLVVSRSLVPEELSGQCA